LLKTYFNKKKFAIILKEMTDDTLYKVGKQNIFLDKDGPKIKFDGKYLH
jgi:hypothetical protein